MPDGGELALSKTSPEVGPGGWSCLELTDTLQIPKLRKGQNLDRTPDIMKYNKSAMKSW